MRLELQKMRRGTAAICAFAATSKAAIGFADRHKK
jgi:hypothetical protein